MNKEWSDEAWEDYLNIQTDKRLLKKKQTNFLKTLSATAITGLESLNL